MTKINVNIQDFQKRFSDEYDFLYDHDDNVAGYDEAVEAFDDLLESNENFQMFVSDFCAFRNDPISSDREAGAFMFALSYYMN